MKGPSGGRTEEDEEGVAWFLDSKHIFMHVLAESKSRHQSALGPSYPLLVWFGRIHTDRACAAAALSRRAARQDTLTGAPVAEDTLMFAVPVTHNAAELRAVSQPFFPPFLRAFWLPGATMSEKTTQKCHEKWR